jgi:hypothetical protein
VDPGGIFLDNEALQFQSIIMSSSHCLASIPRMNVATHTETLSQGIFHANSIYESHQVCHSFLISFQQLYANHCKFYDGIESWLEESYMSTFHMNHNTTKFNMLGGGFS